MKATKILRWIAVLPGAVIASEVLWIIEGYWYKHTFHTFSLLPQKAEDFIGMALLGFSGGWVATTTGQWIAPSHKKATGLVLGSLLVLWYGLGLALMLLYLKKYGYAPQMAYDATSTIAAIIGTTFAAVIPLASSTR